MDSDNNRRAGPQEQRGYRLAPLLAAFAGVLITLAVAALAYRSESQRWNYAFRHAAGEAVTTFSTGIQSSLDILEYVGSFRRNSQVVTTSEFHDFVQPILHKHRGVDFVAWMRYLPEKHRRRFVASMEAAGHPRFQLFQLDDQGKRIPAAAQGHYFVVTKAEPSGNRRIAMGFTPRLGDHPGERGRAIERALTTGQPTATGKLKLLSHEPDESPYGLVAVRPIYRDSGAAEGKSPDRQLLGMTAIGFRLPGMVSFMAPSGADVGLRHLLTLWLDDVTDPDHPTALYRDPGRQNDAGPRTAETSYTRDIHVAGRTWRVTFTPAQGVFPKTAHWGSGLALLFGLALTALLYLYLRNLLWRNRAIQDEVEKRTREISEANRSLAERIRERDQALAQLAESEGRYRLLADNATDLITRHAPDGNTLYASPASRTLLGYKPEEMTRLSAYDLFYPAHLPRIKQEHAYALRHPGVYCGTYKVRRKDGVYIWVESTQRVLTDPRTGEPEQVLSVTRDVTERKRAEGALKNSEALFRSVFDEAGVGMVLFDPYSGRCHRVNHAFCEMVGYTAAELRDMTFHQLTHPADQYVTPSYIERMLAGEVEHYQAEKRYLHKNGQVVWVLNNATLIRDSHGDPKEIISQVQDISDRKRAEEALEQMGRQRDTILNAAAEGILGLDSHGRITFANASAASILGYGPSDLLGSDVLDRLRPHTPDRQPIGATDWALLASMGEQRARHQSDDILTRRDGTSFAAEYTSSPIMEGGRVTGAVVVFSDVTEKRDIEARFRSAFDAAAVGMAMTSLSEDRIKAVNQALCDFLGYSPEEIIGKAPAELTHPDDRDPSTGALRDLLTRGDRARAGLEKRYLRKDGRVVWASISGSVVRDLTGDPAYLVTQIQDISERKRLAEELAAASTARDLLLETIAEAVLMVDGNGRISTFNVQAAALTGYQPPELAGLAFETLLEGGGSSGRLRRADGKTVAVNCVETPLDRGNPGAGRLIILHSSH